MERTQPEGPVMDEKEVVKLAVVGIAGFYVGRIVTEYRVNKKRLMIAKRQQATQENIDFWQTITKYLNDPSDKRTVEQMIDDWQTNLKFHQIVNKEE